MTSLRFERYLTILIPLMIGVFSCKAQTPQKSEASSNRTLPWPSSTPTAEGIDPEVIESINKDILDGKYGLIDHFLLIRNGKIIVDFSYSQNYDSVAANYDTTNHQYNYDHPQWHPFYGETDLHTLQSVTKSVTSAAMGIAFDRGFITDLNAPVLSMFNMYKLDTSDPLKGAVTLENLLTMQSGIDWNEMTSYDDASNSCIIMESSEEWVQFVLDQPMKNTPGTTFDYNSGVSVLLGQLVQIATSERVDKWTDENLFKPIGIKDYYWKTTPSGEVDTEGGLYLSTYDLARIGYLYLNEGIWEGKQIISREWIKKSTSPIIPDVFPENGRKDAGYGYQWWIPDHDGYNAKVFAGNGYGGQFVLVAPDYDIVVVFNGWNIHGGAALSTWRALQDRILPATKQE